VLHDRATHRRLPEPRPTLPTLVFEIRPDLERARDQLVREDLTVNVRQVSIECVMIDEYRGTLLSDGYAKQKDDVRHAECWSNCRRGFELAQDAEKRIGISMPFSWLRPELVGRVSRVGRALPSSDEHRQGNGDLEKPYKGPRWPFRGRFGG